jgi:16S rRNA (guanine527-N7)-methyltransferase
LGTGPEWERFILEVQALGVGLQGDCISPFAAYLKELQDWNRSVRLVSRADAKTVLWAHFLDSLALAPLIQKEGPLLDVGSGGGFPGIPVKIAKPSLALHLVESRRRKANFLRHLVRVLGLKEVWVHQVRLGKGGVQLGQFPLVVGRAVARPDVWLCLAQSLLAEGGRVFLMLGRAQASLELEGSLKQLGWDVVERKDYKLPCLERWRSILVLGR